MEKRKKIEQLIGLIRSIRYRNANGGPYAYLQYMAYVREVALLLRPAAWADRELDRMEQTAWIFNEYLGSRFTHAQEAIFENEMLEVMPLVDRIADTLASRKHPAMISGVAEPPHVLAA